MTRMANELGNKGSKSQRCNFRRTCLILKFVVFLIIFWPKSSKHDKTKRSDSNLRKTGWSEMFALLESQKAKHEEEFEVLVTDDSNGMESKSLVENRFPFASWDQGKNGPAGNRNAGVARAKGEWIVFGRWLLCHTRILEAYSNAISQYPKRKCLRGIFG